VRRPLLVLACLLAAPATADARPYGFFATPTDQLGTPPSSATTEVTPEGYLYTGSAELTFAAGRRLEAWDQPTRRLEDGALPILRSRDRIDGIDYALTVFADTVEGAPVNFVRVVARNPGRRTRRAGWAFGLRDSIGPRVRSGAPRFRFLRPATPARPGLYEQPGEPFSPAARYDAEQVGDAGETARATTLLRDGRILLSAPGDAKLRLHRGALRHAHGRCPCGPALHARAARQPHARGPHAGRPLDPASPAASALPDAPFATHRSATAQRWRAALAPAMELDVPERKVEDAFRASLMHLLLPRHRTADGQWVQTVNQLQYHAFWLRDAAIMTNALDLAGLHAPARENLDFFGSWQLGDGLFISRPGQLDGHGQALWAIGEHVRRTGDLDFARRMLGPVERAVDWLARTRRQDPLGLVPPSDPNDNELVAGHLAGDNFWAVAGMESAVALARALGDGERAEAWRRELDDLRTTVLGRVREVAARTPRGAIPPSLDAPGGEDWGNLWAAYPAAVLDPRDPAVSATLARVRADAAEGLPLYGAGMHGYLGFRIWQTELARGEQAKVVQGLYDALAHTTATHGGFELGIRPYGSRSTDDNMTPHGWFAAELVALIRNVVVREAPDGAIELGAALPPAWLRPGRRVAVRNAATVAGPLSFTLRSRRGGATLSWDAAGLRPGMPLRFVLPRAARAVRVDGAAPDGSTIPLAGPRGEVSITWRLARATTSFAKTVERLRRAYRARGVTPP
jgi:hypothetical protein